MDSSLVIHDSGEVGASSFYFLESQKHMTTCHVFCVNNEEITITITYVTVLLSYI